MQCLVLAILFASPLSQEMAKQPPLIEAIQKGDIAVATKLLKSGSNPNARLIVTTKPSASKGLVGGHNDEDRTALNLAVDRQSLPLVDLLLTYKADPNARGPYEWTPLMSACQRSNVEIVKRLLKHGAKPNLKNAHGDTAIIFAANMDSVKMVDELIKAGADMNGGTGQTALIIASMCGSKQTVKLLLKKGADPNFRRPPYWTPLEYALRSYDDELAAILKKAGAKGRPVATLKKEEEVASKLMRKEIETEQKAKAASDAKFAKLLPDDAAVLEAALVDMTQCKEFELTLFGKAKNLTLLNESSGSVNEYTESQMNGELDEKKANDIDLTMRRDLMRRNASKVSLATCKFSDTRVLLGDADSTISTLGRFPNSNSSTMGWVRVLLPGYSADGRRAVLRFWFGPTPHGAAGTYLLEKKDEKWQVVWRDFAHYV